MYSARKEAWSARQDGRHSYYPTAHARMDGRYNNGESDSPNFTPAAAVARARHPAMLVEDVEGQTGWDYDERHRRFVKARYAVLEKPFFLSWIFLTSLLVYESPFSWVAIGRL